MARAKNVPAFSTLADVDRAIGEIGRLQREVVIATKKHDAEIAEIKARAMEYVSPRQETIDRLAGQVAAYAKAHRTELLEPGTKTKVLSTGAIRWAMGRPSVTIKKRRKIKDVVAYIVSLGNRFSWMLRQPDPELNREAILQYGAIPEELADHLGIKKGTEVFYITPHGSPVEDITIKL